MKYEEFDKLITEMSRENASDDYWYDVGVSDAMTLLEKFSEDDWKVLGNNVIDKPLEWQKRLVYCFEEENDAREINIILSLIETTDKELFEMCIDSLRFLINDNNKDYIINNNELMKKLRKVASIDNTSGRVCSEFLNKLQ
ncbi:hypothetical protein [Clostridium saccharoperbutylacetonicum]|uniref:hypothetical protein n=1 Tax=Clostridium saccharoperbutylacetonicum TaxID=36745 RepID=UPI000983C9B0|nr:hypothetical protein [Clostridium saccharoperbutylacetonicum]AQR94355.1 hypothetical protein CLSAP_16620 [Clostridium saccharoperbutylacetonicum]NSB30055.1 hypothetical protein [Clostridium saccharoperbutylacetonicum]